MSQPNPNEQAKLAAKQYEEESLKRYHERMAFPHEPEASGLLKKGKIAAEGVAASISGGVKSTFEKSKDIARDMTQHVANVYEKVKEQPGVTEKVKEAAGLGIGRLTEVVDTIRYDITKPPEARIEADLSKEADISKKD